MEQFIRGGTILKEYVSPIRLVCIATSPYLGKEKTMQNMLKRSLLFGLASLGAVVGIGVWTTGSIRSAQAQSTTSAESHSMIFKSGGPLQLQDGERALIGLLLPAVKKRGFPSALFSPMLRGTLQS